MAAKITITATGETTSRERSRQGSGVVQNGDTIHAFVVDSGEELNVYKSTDNGDTWAEVATIGIGDVRGWDICARKWVGESSDLVDVVYVDDNFNNIYHRTFDTSDDSVGTENTVVAADVNGFTQWATIQRTPGGKLLVAARTRNTTDAVYHYVSDNDGSTWTEKDTTTLFGSVTDVDPVCYTIGNETDQNDSYAIFYDKSATALKLFPFDYSAGTFETAVVLDANVDVDPEFVQFDCCYDKTSKKSWIIYWNETNTSTADLRCIEITNKSTQTQRTNVLDNTSGGSLCRISRDGSTLRVWYTRGTWQTTTHIYYKESTDDGVTWGAEQQMTDDPGGHLDWRVISAGNEDSKKRVVAYDDDSNDWFWFESAASNDVLGTAIGFGLSDGLAASTVTQSAQAEESHTSYELALGVEGTAEVEGTAVGLGVFDSQGAMTVTQSAVAESLSTTFAEAVEAVGDDVLGTAEEWSISHAIGFDCVVLEADYWVDAKHPLASDSNDGLTEDTPFLTIKKAMTVVQAGETVVVKGHNHTYVENNPSQNAFQAFLSPDSDGTSGNPITCQAYPGHSVTISGVATQGVGSENMPVMGSDGKDFVRWLGFKTDRAVVFQNCNNCELAYCELEGAFIASSDNHDALRVDRQLGGPGLNFWAHHNYIRGVKGNTMNSAGIKEYNFDGVSTGNIFENNWIDNCTSGIFLKNSNAGSIVRENYLTNIDDIVMPGDANTGTPDAGYEVYNNVFDSSSAYGGYVRLAQDNDGCKVHHNLVIGTGTRRFSGTHLPTADQAKNTEMHSNVVRIDTGGGEGLLWLQGWQKTDNEHVNASTGHNVAVDATLRYRDGYSDGPAETFSLAQIQSAEPSGWGQEANSEESLSMSTIYDGSWNLINGYDTKGLNGSGVGPVDADGKGNNSIVAMILDTTRYGPSAMPVCPIETGSVAIGFASSDESAQAAVTQSAQAQAESSLDQAAISSVTQSAAAQSESMAFAVAQETAEDVVMAIAEASGLSDEAGILGVIQSGVAAGDSVSFAEGVLALTQSALAEGHSVGFAEATSAEENVVEGVAAGLGLADEQGVMAVVQAATAEHASHAVDYGVLSVDQSAVAEHASYFLASGVLSVVQAATAEETSLAIAQATGTVVVGGFIAGGRRTSEIVSSYTSKIADSLTSKIL